MWVTREAGDGSFTEWVADPAPAVSFTAPAPAAPGWNFASADPLGEVASSLEWGSHGTKASELGFAGRVYGPEQWVTREVGDGSGTFYERGGITDDFTSWASANSVRVGYRRDGVDELAQLFRGEQKIGDPVRSHKVDGNNFMQFMDVAVPALILAMAGGAAAYGMGAAGGAGAGAGAGLGAADSAVGVTLAADAAGAYAAEFAAAEVLAGELGAGIVVSGAAADTYAAEYAAAEAFATPAASSAASSATSASADSLIGSSATSSALPSASTVSSAGASIVDTIGSAIVKAAGSVLAPVATKVLGDKLNDALAPDAQSATFQPIGQAPGASTLFPLLLIAGAVALAFVATSE